MRKLSGAVVLAAVSIAMAGPAWAVNICISTGSIVDTQPQKDGKAILFKMQDGSEWRNDLQGACPDLRFDGFVWVVRNPDGTVCENEQTLRVLQSGEICALGKFTQVKPARNKKKM